MNFGIESIAEFWVIVVVAIGIAALSALGLSHLIAKVLLVLNFRKPSSRLYWLSVPIALLLLVPVITLVIYLHIIWTAYQ